MSYKKLSKIDYGQYSKIYLVENEEGEKQVLKVCLKELGYSFGMSYREADIAFRFQHPNCICLHATYQGVPFEGTEGAVSPLGREHENMGHDVNHLVYELAECNFQKFIVENPTYNELISCICDVLLGMEHMHLSGYCHRDLRCDNILIFKHEENPKVHYAKVADFGFTKYLVKNESNTPQINIDSHRAPECIRFCRDYGFGVDMWSLGCIVYTAFCYEAPFRWGGLKPAEGINLILNKLPVECGGKNTIENFFPKPSIVTNYELLSELLVGLLQFDPERRLSASEALDLPLFDRQRKQIEATRKEYPPVLLPDKKLEIFNCIERKWGVEFFQSVFTKRFEKPASIWYRDSIFFFALSIFDQVLVYYHNHEKPARKMEGYKSGRYFTRRQLSIVYITCVYFAIKYKSGIDSNMISYESVYPDFSIKLEEKKFAANFELKLFTQILDQEIYRKTLYDCVLEESGTPSSDELLSLTRFVLYGHFNGKKLNSAYRFWKRNINYYID